MFVITITHTPAPPFSPLAIALLAAPGFHRQITAANPSAIQARHAPVRVHVYIAHTLDLVSGVHCQLIAKSYITCQTPYEEQIFDNVKEG